MEKTHINLVILSPSPEVNKLTFSGISTATNVGELREKISVIVATHPAPARQRLIYRGHALIDMGKTLKDIFTQEIVCLMPCHSLRKLTMNRSIAPIPSRFTWSYHQKQPLSQLLQRPRHPQAKASRLRHPNRHMAALIFPELRRIRSRLTKRYMHSKDQLPRVMSQHLHHHTITYMGLDMGMVLFRKDNSLHNFNRLLPSSMLSISNLQLNSRLSETTLCFRERLPINLQHSRISHQPFHSLLFNMPWRNSSKQEQQVDSTGYTMAPCRMYRSTLPLLLRRLD